MAFAQITVSEHAFNVSLPVISNRTTDLFLELTFDGEGNTSAVDHISNFFYKCLRHKIIDSNVTCRLFALTFRGQVKVWFESFQLFLFILCLSLHLNFYQILATMIMMN
jgi:hypothetical protein